MSASEVSFLTARFDRAAAYAREAHGDQLRKGTRIPYVSHLFAVASLVLEDGGDEDEAIAALLHDAAEDAGGQQRLDEIRARFGDRVADIVLACSDSLERRKPPWRARKEAYLKHLREADASVLRVSAADKLHNLRSILADWKQIGDRVWERFSAPKREQLWYYTELVATYRAGGVSGRLVDELGLSLELMRHVVEASA